MEGFAGASIDQLISIVAKVVANQEEMAKREKKKIWRKRQRSWLLSQGGRWEDQRPEGRPNRREWRNPLGKNQCAYCKEEEHWKNDALTRKKRKKKE
jgi:hypothetical protein